MLLVKCIVEKSNQASMPTLAQCIGGEPESWRRLDYCFTTGVGKKRQFITESLAAII